jgi:hypothetical protein
MINDCSLTYGVALPAVKYFYVWKRERKSWPARPQIYLNNGYLTYAKINYVKITKKSEYKKEIVGDFRKQTKKKTSNNRQYF